MKLTQQQIVLATCLLLLVVLFGWNNVLELRAEEPRRAIVSLEMLLRGEYWVPKIHDWSYYNKPPLFNWWMALCFKLFGSFDEWVVRMPSLIAFLATALLNFFLVKRFLSGEVALYSSLFFLTSADILFYGTVNAGEIDLFFSLLVYGQVMAIFIFRERKQFLLLFLCSYFLAALGTLTKGPPSIAFQGLTLLPWLIINGQWKLLFNWKHFAGIGFYVLIVGAYFYQYANYDDAIGFMVRLFKEAAQRTGLEHSFGEILIQSATFPFYLLQLMAPWSLLILFFFRKDFLSILRSTPLLSFCGVFILFNLPLYWFTADHKARYLYMFFPFFCILFAYFFINVSLNLLQWKNKIMQLFFGLMILITIAFLAPPFIHETAAIPHIIWKCFLLIIAGLSLIWLYRKLPEWQVNVFILFILLLRLGINFTYLPATAKYSSRLIYREHIKQVLAITKDEPVHWCGEPFTFESDASIGPFTLKKVKLTSAPLVAYQIPYYLTKGNGYIMQYDTVLRENRYYLAHEEFVKNQPVKILYRFPDKWLDREMVLFRKDGL